MNIRRDVFFMDCANFRVGHISIDGPGRSLGLVLLGCDLQSAARAVNGGKAVDALSLPLKFPNENRKILRKE